MLRNCAAIMHFCASTMRIENSSFVTCLYLRNCIANLTATNFLANIVQNCVWNIDSCSKIQENKERIILLFFLQVLMRDDFDKFWLYRKFLQVLTSSKILTLFWPINPIKTQLPNNQNQLEWVWLCNKNLKQFWLCWL